MFYAKFIPALFAFFTLSDLHAQQYTFTAYLNKTRLDRLPVELLAPPQKNDTVLYYMPEIVPGIYGRMDFGAYVSDFQALDAGGKPLPVVQLNKNTWQIAQARKLNKLHYWVDDTWDTPHVGINTIFNSAGSSYNQDSLWALNHNALFGYFEGQTGFPYEVIFHKPAGFYGATSMQAVERTDTSERYRMPDYRRLVDAPILFARPDTATLNVGGTAVLIAVFSDSGKPCARYTANILDSLLRAQLHYLGGKLPVKKYAFLITHYSDIDAGSYMFDALEHATSSFYFIRASDFTKVPWVVRDIAAHEFLHILTPLNLHSYEVEHYDFNHPALSRHLWLYEGMTEYTTHHLQVQEKLITPDEFLKRLEEKIANSKQFRPDVALTDISLHALDEYASEYTNVYQLGALACLCLDLELLKRSNGLYGTRHLMRDLIRKYGPDKPFRDEELFDEIAKMTHPSIREFFTFHVEGISPLPLKQVFDYVGVKVEPGGKLKWVENLTSQQEKLRKSWLGQ